MVLTKVNSRGIKNAELSVLDFGVVADGSTDNTAAYTNLITAAPAGSTIFWPAGTYRGRFHSNKAFHLKGGPNVILKPPNDTDDTSDGAVIRFVGTEDSPQAMSAQPVFGADQIAHSGGGTLAVGDIVRLWDGWTRPSNDPNNRPPINRELVKVREATNSGVTKIEGTVLSNQTHGTYTYTKLNTLKNISIHDFKIELGTSSTVHGIWCYRAENVKVSNIHLTGGKGTSIRLQDTYNAHVTDTSRTNCNDTESGNGYHLLLFVAKWARVEHVRGHVTRHVVDLESAYHISVRDAYATHSGGTPFIISHNSSGGFQHWENLFIENSTVGTNGISAVAQGLGENVVAAEKAKRAAEILRNVTIKNYYERSNRTTDDKEPASIYLQYQCKNLVLKDIYILEEGTLSGNAIDADIGQKGIRISGPIGGQSSITGVHVEGRPIVIMMDSDAANGKHTYAQDFPRESETLIIRDISCKNVKKIFYFKGPIGSNAGSYYQYFDIRDVHVLTGTAEFGTNGNDWDCYLDIPESNVGQGRFELDQIPNAMGTGENKVVKNTRFLLYFNSMKNSMSSSLTATNNTLFQSDMISAGSPAGRYFRVQSSPINKIEKPCGYGQVARFQCGGAITFDVSAINNAVDSENNAMAGLSTHDGNDFITGYNDWITLVSTDNNNWRIWKDGQSADTSW